MEIETNRALPMFNVDINKFFKEDKELTKLE